MKSIHPFIPKIFKICLVVSQLRAADMWILRRKQNPHTSVSDVTRGTIWCTHIQHAFKEELTSLKKQGNNRGVRMIMIKQSIWEATSRQLAGSIAD